MEFNSAGELMTALWEVAVDPLLREEKDGRAIIPARPCPPRADGLYEGKDGQPTPTPYRRNANFSHVTLGIVDFDGETQAALEAWLASLRRRGLCFIAYPTHSYGRTAKPIRYRVVFPFSEPVPVGSPGRWSERLWPRLMQCVGLGELTEAALKADASCKDVARLYYLPSWDPTNALPRPAPEHHQGQPLDVQAEFGPLLRVPFARYAERPNEEQVDGLRAANPSDVRKRLQRFKRSDAVTVLAQMDAGEVLMLDGQRHLGINKLTELLAWVAKPDESSASLLECARRSLDALAHLEPSRDVWGEALRGLRGARAKLTQWDRQRAAQRAAEYAEWRRALGLAASAGHHNGGEQ
ncbi:hypothetical protein GTZ93_42025 [Corallococcus exiguus]|uniref:Uncharacterized protein n=2 Tax=Corallococcus exiguus TaxID=83462 RepID=A0A7X4YJE6_9BACT|nr:hypothetical protein [Corallococcus exiguus]NBC46375.1 hypothetical protein [Corallococcus exiguus]